MGLQEMTVVGVFHDLNFAVRYADEVLVINHGTVIRYGKVKEVLTEELALDVFRVCPKWVKGSDGEKLIWF